MNNDPHCSVLIPSFSGLLSNSNPGAHEYRRDRLNPFFFRSAFEQKEETPPAAGVWVLIPSFSGLLSNPEMARGDPERGVLIPSFSGLLSNDEKGERQWLPMS